MQIMNLNEVCKLLQITDQTGRNRLSSGMPMPPNFRVGRRRLFIAEDVINWIKRQSTSDDKTPTPVDRKSTPILRGRPTKASQFGHQR